MTNSEIIQFIGLLISSWSIGFAAGYILTKFKDALSLIV